MCICILSHFSKSIGYDASRMFLSKMVLGRQPLSDFDHNILAGVTTEKAFSHFEIIAISSSCFVRSFVFMFADAEPRVPDGVISEITLLFCGFVDSISHIGGYSIFFVFGSSHLYEVEVHDVSLMNNVLASIAQNRAEHVSKPLPNLPCRCSEHTELFNSNPRPQRKFRKLLRMFHRRKKHRHHRVCPYCMYIAHPALNEEIVPIQTL